MSKVLFDVVSVLCQEDLQGSLEEPNTAGFREPPERPRWAPTLQRE